MGSVPREDTQRNSDLISDYNAKNESGDWLYTLSQLGWLYKRIVNGMEVPLSTTRIYQIMDKHNVPRRSKEQPNKQTD